MAMPEAAMDEHDRPMPGQHDVGTTRQLTDMKAISVASRVEQSAHYQLGLGVLASYSRHALRAVRR